MTYFNKPDYGMSTTLKGVSHEDAIERTKAALKEEGFGVLTTIDIKATLKKKLDVDHRPYVILGACNPGLAHQALSAEAPIGLLLPCNVVVTQDDNGDAVVAAINGEKMFSVVNRDDLGPIAKKVTASLGRMIDSLK
ncbi:DUF302 domain-containing protein [Bradymonas sediminis]|nr:DUF302 domain-containing protein [Bradymonas sediminis]TDP63636.1 uncharacterized protein (DUF302 family) [Bradymonas sediminis]